jgi:hypothetical protein
MPYLFFTNYNLYTSLSPLDFSPESKLASGTLYDDNTAPEKDYYDHIIFSNPINARYILFESTGSSTHWAHLDELEVYGFKSVDTTAVPEPSSALLLGIGILGLTRLVRRKSQ